MDAVTYAWCFSHGRMHFFRPSDEHPDGAWCTALWTLLAGDTEESALADKQARFADARFAHELGPEQHLEVFEAHAARNPERWRRP
ncbi:hypothetical protein [Actinomadura luteofluorescens]|uniref:hypothetical protein n=1 Tax=Actinomadura luteofluorescens TaxID=46163 RepID=UPI003D93AF9F